LNIEDFLFDRACSNYGGIYSNPEYRKCCDRLDEIHEVLKTKLDSEGETIFSEVKSLHNNMAGITSMCVYRRGFSDGLRLGWLLAEVKDDNSPED